MHCCELPGSSGPVFPDPSTSIAVLVFPFHRFTFVFIRVSEGSRLRHFADLVIIDFPFVS